MAIRDPKTGRFVSASNTARDIADRFEKRHRRKVIEAQKKQRKAKAKKKRKAKVKKKGKGRKVKEAPPKKYIRPGDIELQRIRKKARKNVAITKVLLGKMWNDGVLDGKNYIQAMIGLEKESEFHGLDLEEIFHIVDETWLEDDGGLSEYWDYDETA